MEIEARGTLEFLNGFGRVLRLELEKNGYAEGPRVGRMEFSGTCWTLLKKNRIITIQVIEGSESENASLRLESESEVPGIEKIWDDALVAFGRTVYTKIRDLAHDSKKVEAKLKE